VDFEAYFKAPERLWRPKMFTPEELEAIEVGVVGSCDAGYP